jgi:hypothetical protein
LIDPNAVNIKQYDFTTKSGLETLLILAKDPLLLCPKTYVEDKWVETIELPNANAQLVPILAAALEYWSDIALSKEII